MTDLKMYFCARKNRILVIGAIKYQGEQQQELTLIYKPLKSIYKSGARIVSSVCSQNGWRGL